MKNKILLLLTIVAVVVSCGKGGEIGPVKKADGGIGQIVNPEEIRSSAMTSTEKALGKSFCDDLQYRNANFLALYGTTKKFKFNVNLKDCARKESAGRSTYQYKATNGLLTFNQLLDDGPVITPTVEIDTNGAYKEFCDVRNNITSRMFGNDQDFKYYVFYEGGDCPADAICGDLRIVQANVTIYAKKVKLMHSSAANNQFSLSIRGQELADEIYQKCDEGEAATQFFTLDSILNI